MSDGKLLVLLPPRQTTQPASSASKTSKPQPSTTSFSHKLEKAKKEKSAPAVKKPVAATAPKPAVPAKTTAQPKAETSAQEDDSGNNTTTDQKAGDDQDQTGTGDKNPASEASPQTQKASVAEAATAAAQVAPEKTAAPPPRPKTDTGKKNPDGNPTPQQDPSSGKDPKAQPVAVKAAPPASTSLDQPQAGASGSTNASSTAANETSSSNSSASDSSTDAPAVVYGSGKIVSARDLSNNQAVVAESANSQSTGDSGANFTQAPESAQSAAAQPAASIAPVVVVPAQSSVHLNSDSSGAEAVGNIVAGKTTTPLAGKSVATPTPSPQAKFVAENQPKIVSSIQGQLLPNGGTMQIQLNPSELGALQVTVNVKDGVISAAFETSSDHATKLLSHSLGQLKSGLEASGVTVEKLQVAQAPKQDASSDSDSESDSKQAPQEQQQQAQQDQQRRAMVQRMWRKLSGVEEPLDMVA